MSGCVNSMMFPKNLLGDLVEQLTGSELKVMLFLALRTNGFATSADGIRVREIADCTRLSKKEVRVALRMLAINAAFRSRFQASAATPQFSTGGQRIDDPLRTVGAAVAWSLWDQRCVAAPIDRL